MRMPAWALMMPRCPKCTEKLPSSHPRAKQPSTDGQDEADTLRAELRELKHMRRAEVSHPH